MRRDNRRDLALAVALVAVVFLLDWIEPAGYAVWLGYLFPVFIAAWAGPPLYTFLLTAVCTVLIGVGAAIPPTGAISYVVLVNRSLDALVLWIIAILILQRKHAQQEREQLLQKLAAVEERQRLARELHDAVSQNLFSASLIADVIPRLWQSNREEGQRRLHELQRLTRGALAEMRTLLLELRPAALAEAPLEDSLRQLATAAAGRSHLQVNANIQCPLALPSEVKIGLYRIAQEALNNVIKHAGAEEARLDLICPVAPSAAPEQVELCITDDGHGFESRGLSSDHMGLRIMRERAESIGAELAVQSQVGKGTQVIVIWPGM